MSLRTLLVLAATIALLTLGFALPARGMPPTDQEEPQYASLCGAGNADVLFLVDQSGSMFVDTDPGGTPCINPDGTTVTDAQGRVQYCGDALPVRQTAASYFIDSLGTEVTAGMRVSIAYFGAQTDRVVDLFEATDAAAREAAIAFLQDLPDDPTALPYYRWTDTNLAFQKAYEMFEEIGTFREGRVPVVIFLSDGQPDVAGFPRTGCGPAFEAYYRDHLALTEQLRQAGVRVFTLLITVTGKGAQAGRCLDSAQEFEGYQNIWEHISAQTEGEYATFETSDPQRLHAETFLRVREFLARIGCYAPPDFSEPKPICGGETVREVVSVDRCERLTISVDRSSPTIGVTLNDPAGSAVPPQTVRDAYLIFVTESLQKSSFELVLTSPAGEGCGYYVRTPECISPGMVCEIVSPQGEFQQCKPMGLAAQVWAGKEKEAVEDARVYLKVTTPDGAAKEVPLQHAEGALYTGSVAGSQMGGTVALECTAEDPAGGLTRAVSTASVRVVPGYYLEFKSPLPGGPYSGGTVTFEASVMTACWLAGGDAVLSGPDSDVTATLRKKKSGQPAGSVRLADDGQEPDTKAQDGVFSGWFQDVKEGTYILTLSLVNRARGAQDQISGEVSFVDKTAVPHCTARLASDTLEAKPGESARVELILDCSKVDVDQSIVVSLPESPFSMEPVTTLVAARTLDSRVNLVIPVPQGLDPGPEGLESRDLSLTLRLRHPDGVTNDLPFAVRVTAVPHCMARLASGALEAGPGESARAELILDCSQVDGDQSIAVSLLESPFAMEPVTPLIAARTSDGRVSLVIPVPAELDPGPEGLESRDYALTLRLRHPDGVTDDLPFSLKVRAGEARYGEVKLPAAGTEVIARPGETLTLTLDVDASGANRDYTMETSLSGPVEHLTLGTTEIACKAGDARRTQPLTIRVSESAQAGSYPVTLRAAFPDGTARDLPFTLVIPEKTAWQKFGAAIVGGGALLLIVAAVLLAILIAGKRSRGKLTGRIVFAVTPVGASRSDELLDGKGEEYELPLTEVPGAPQAPDAAPAAGRLDYGMDYSVEPAQPAPTSAAWLTRLVFSARKKTKEARLMVAETNTSVAVDGAAVRENEVPLQLRDGMTITVGSYVLRYECLGAGEPEQAPPPAPADQEWDSGGYSAG